MSHMCLWKTRAVAFGGGKPEIVDEECAACGKRRTVIVQPAHTPGCECPPPITLCPSQAGASALSSQSWTRSYYGPCADGRHHETTCPIAQEAQRSSRPATGEKK